MAAFESRYDFMEGYFHMGLSYKEIVDCLFINHEITMKFTTVEKSFVQKQSWEATLE